MEIPISKKRLNKCFNYRYVTTTENGTGACKWLQIKNNLLAEGMVWINSFSFFNQLLQSSVKEKNSFIASNVRETILREIFFSKSNKWSEEQVMQILIAQHYDHLLMSGWCWLSVPIQSSSQSSVILRSSSTSSCTSRTMFSSLEHSASNTRRYDELTNVIFAEKNMTGVEERLGDWETWFGF